MDYNNIQFYQQNILRGLANWEILNNASIVNDTILINSGGSAGNNLSNSYFYGLLNSNYRRLAIEVEVDTAELSNYQNNVEIVIVGLYVDNSGIRYRLYHSVNVNLLKNSYTGSKVSMIRVVGMQNMPMLNCTVYVLNHTDIPITLTKCEMLRSQDITDGQIAGGIGFAVTLNSVINHPNGAEILYNGIEQSDKLFWILDSNDKFAGINVNNVNRINWSTTDEIMIM